MNRDIPFGQRCITLSELTKARAGEWVSEREIEAHWHKVFGTRPRPGQVNGPVQCLLQGPDQGYTRLRGNKIRYETETMRLTRLLTKLKG